MGRAAPHLLGAALSACAGGAGAPDTDPSLGGNDSSDTFGHPTPAPTTGADTTPATFTTDAQATGSTSATSAAPATGHATSATTTTTTTTTTTAESSGGSGPTPHCGDGVPDPGEACDDGNNLDTDACLATCEAARCGDAVLWVGVEDCDDANADDGDGCLSDCTSPIGATRIVAGSYHSCAVIAGSAARCWGDASNGQLGLASVLNVGDDEPASTGGNIAIGDAVVALAAGAYHTCALVQGGRVRCWGQATQGQLGYANTTTIGDDEDPSTAGDVDLGAGAVELAAGYYHTCARLADGQVRCWGAASSGQLGYGNTTKIGDNETPASAGSVSLDDAAVQIAAGGYHSCVLLQSGSVQCWGYGASGRLGYGDSENVGNDELPTAVGAVQVGGLVAEVVAGASHTCARMTSGAVRCWGSATGGRLGYANLDDIGDDEHPATTGDVDVGGSAAKLTAGADHTCALITDGTVRCWGVGSLGQLGYGNQEPIGDDEVPSAAGTVQVGALALGLAAGFGHTCARIDSNALRCWGNAAFGQLGYASTATIGDDEAPETAGNVPVE